MFTTLNVNGQIRFRSENVLIFPQTIYNANDKNYTECNVIKKIMIAFTYSLDFCKTNCA